MVCSVDNVLLSMCAFKCLRQRFGATSRFTSASGVESAHFTPGRDSEPGPLRTPHQHPPHVLAPFAAMAALPETLGTSLVQSRMVVNLSQQLLSEEPSLAAQGATNLTRLLLSEGGIEVLFREPAGIVVRPAAHPLAHSPLRSRAKCGPAVFCTAARFVSSTVGRPRWICQAPDCLTASSATQSNFRSASSLAWPSLILTPSVTWLVDNAPAGTGGAQAVSQLGVLMQIAATKGPQVRELVILKIFLL